MPNNLYSQRKSSEQRKKSHWIVSSLAQVLLATTILVALGNTTFAPIAGASDGEDTLQQENARLRDENALLREQLEALKAPTSGELPPSPVVQPQVRESPEAGTDTTALEASYVPMNRVSLTVSRDTQGQARVIATPWYRAVEHTRGLPRRDFVQLRARPARADSPEQAWLTLQRRAVPSVVDDDAPAKLRIGTWSGEARVVQQDIQRQRRRKHKGSSPALRDELVVFALPPGTLERIASSDQSTFETDAISFSFTDDQVAGAAAVVARLNSEKRNQPNQTP